MKRYVQGKDGKMQGSIGAGKNKVPTASSHAIHPFPREATLLSEGMNLPQTWAKYQHLQEQQQMHATLHEICSRSVSDKDRLPLIGLDLDNTIGDFTHGLRMHVARKRDIPLSLAEEVLPDPDAYCMWEGKNSWFRDRAHFLEDFQEFEADGGYRRLPLYPGVDRTLRILESYGFGFMAFTSRGSAFNEDTEAWLRRHRLPVAGIVNAGPHKQPVEGIDLYIEDNPSAVDSLSAAGAKVVVFDQEYNDETDGDARHTHRVNGWHSPRLVAAMGVLLLNPNAE